MIALKQPLSARVLPLKVLRHTCESLRRDFLKAIAVLYGEIELEPLPWDSKVRFTVNADVRGRLWNVMQTAMSSLDTGNQEWEVKEDKYLLRLTLGRAELVPSFVSGPMRFENGQRKVWKPD